MRNPAPEASAVCVLLRGLVSDTWCARWLVFGVVAAAVASPVPGNAHDALLRWTVPPQADTAGYRVHMGRATRTYDQQLELSGLESTTLNGVVHAFVPNLLPGVTYYVAVTAYSSAGMESELSNEKTHLLTAVTPPRADAGPDRTGTVDDIFALGSASEPGVAYFWQQISGPPATLSTRTSSLTVFRATTTGTFMFAVTAYNSQAAARDFVTVVLSQLSAATPTSTRPSQTRTPTVTRTPNATQTGTATSTPANVQLPTTTPTETPIVLCESTPISSGCAQPDKSVFRLRRNSSNLTGHTMLWRWTKSPEVEMSAFGAPVSSTTYALCVYDQSAGARALAMNTVVPAGRTCAGNKPCWSQVGRQTPKGFRYKDVEQSQHGIAQIVLKGKEGGKTKIVVIGKGQHLPVPPAVSGDRLFNQNSKVTVQLVNSMGACWQADFAASAIKNRVDLFKDKCGTRAEGPCS